MTKDQIKLVQIAVKAAGIRSPSSRSKAGPPQNDRYHFLLRQYKQPSGSPVKSCKQLNNSQLEDLLAICESHGWRMPGQPEDFYRKKIAAEYGLASFAARSGIRHMAKDLGWTPEHLDNFARKMTGFNLITIDELKPVEAYKIIEALKVMFNRNNGTNYKTIKEIKDGPPHDSCAEAACGINTGGTSAPKRAYGCTDGSNQGE